MIAAPPRPDEPDTTTDPLRRSRALFEGGDHVEGALAARAALAAAVVAADRVGQYASWDLIALHADRLGHHAVAISAAEEALALLSPEASVARVRLHCRLARVFAVLELDAANLRHATAAVTVARGCDDTEAIAMSLSRLGAACAASGDWAQAVALVEEALVLARAEDNGAEVYRALNNLAVVSYYVALDATRRGDVGAATAAARGGLAWADEAVRHPGTVDDPYCMLVARVNRNLLWVYSGRAQEALDDSRDASADARRRGYREVAAQLDYARGKATTLVGDRAGGVALLETALLATGADERLIRTRLHEELYGLHKASGAFAEALAHHEALLAHERARSARRAAAEYGVLLERAEVQRTRLTAERAQRDAELERLRAVRMEGERDLMEARAAEMGRHALEDPLTGMPNRRRIEAAMATLLAGAGTTQGTVGIGLVDIDRFKTVNDTFGHAVGDDVIRTVGALLTHGLRGADLVGRFGGEEFAVLLSRTSVEAATATVERLRRAIEQHDWSLLRPGLTVTASIGLSFADAPCLPRDAMERTDAALYAAKAAGRDRVWVEPVVADRLPGDHPLPVDHAIGAVHGSS